MESSGQNSDPTDDSFPVKFDAPPTYDTYLQRSTPEADQEDQMPEKIRIDDSLPQETIDTFLSKGYKLVQGERFAIGPEDTEFVVDAPSKARSFERDLLRMATLGTKQTIQPLRDSAKADLLFAEYTFLRIFNFIIFLSTFRAVEDELARTIGLIERLQTQKISTDQIILPRFSIVDRTKITAQLYVTKLKVCICLELHSLLTKVLYYST